MGSNFKNMVSFPIWFLKALLVFTSAMCKGAFSEAGDKLNCDYSMRLCLKRLVNMGVLPQASILMLDNLLTLCFGQFFSLNETGLLQRGILRVMVLTPSCSANEGSVSAHIKIVNVLGLQFTQQLMKSYIYLHIGRVKLFNAVAWFYNILLIKVSLLS